MVDRHLVSCIMPTRGRQQWAAQALDCYRSQTYSHKEFIIIDDADQRSFPQGISAPDITYIVNDIRKHIPQKLNQACLLARGSVIAKWDSDDWSAPERLEESVAMMNESRKAVVGYNSILFYDVATGNVAKYIYGKNDWVSGTSLCFTKEWWLRHKFGERHVIASDRYFEMEATNAKQTYAVDVRQMQVARIHSGNSSPKRTYGKSWHKRTLDDLPAAFLKLIEVGAVH